jgi:hypothetical protein
MKQAIDKKRMKEESYKYPNVIAVVLYTGTKSWNASLKLADIQDTLSGYDEIKEDYKLIDVNEYTKEELLEDNLLISKAMILEKSKTNEDLIMDFEKVAKSVIENNVPHGEYFLEVASRYLVNPEIRKETKEIVEKIKNEKGVDSTMLNMVRVQLEAYEKARQEGRAEAEEKFGAQIEKLKKQNEEIVKNLLKRKMKPEDITQITGIPEEEILNLQEKIG